MVVSQSCVGSYQQSPQSPPCKLSRAQGKQPGISACQPCRPMQIRLQSTFQTEPSSGPSASNMQTHQHSMPQLQNMFKDEGWAEYVGQLTSTLPHELPASSQSNASVQPTAATRGTKQSRSQHDQWHLELLPELSVVSW